MEKIVIEGFENEREGDDEESSLMIPCQSKKDESSLNSKYLKHLDRHLVLVLNADYQVRMILLNEYCNLFSNRKILPVCPSHFLSFFSNNCSRLVMHH